MWPGVTPSENIGSNDYSALKPGETTVFAAPPGWHGRIWGRTGCSFDNSGNGTCQTGSCRSSLKCSGPGQQPATIAEFTLGDPNFYDVSLVGGFNLPMVVEPLNGKGNCSTAGCDSDLRNNCPSELAIKDNGKTIACQSACDVFRTDEYCCRGTYGNAASCKPTNYSTTFKKSCPAAYSYAFDDTTSLITCSSVSDYIVTLFIILNSLASPIHQFLCSDVLSPFHHFQKAIPSLKQQGQFPNDLSTASRILKPFLSETPVHV